MNKIQKYLSEIGRKGGQSGTGDAKKRDVDYKAISALGVAARWAKKKDKQK
jgi:general stress protein YciG